MLYIQIHANPRHDARRVKKKTWLVFIAVIEISSKCITSRVIEVMVLLSLQGHFSRSIKQFIFLLAQKVTSNVTYVDYCMTVL